MFPIEFNLKCLFAVQVCFSCLLIVVILMLMFFYLYFYVFLFFCVCLLIFIFMLLSLFILLLIVSLSFVVALFCCLLVFSSNLCSLIFMFTFTCRFCVYWHLDFVSFVFCLTFHLTSFQVLCRLARRHEQVHANKNRLLLVARKATRRKSFRVVVTVSQVHEILHRIALLLKGQMKLRSVRARQIGQP